MKRFKGLVTYRDGKERVIYVNANDLEHAKFMAKGLYGDLPVRDLKEYCEVDVGDDPYWTLNEWIKFLQKLSSQYNPETTMLLTDAGYNDVTLCLQVLV